MKLLYTISALLLLFFLTSCTKERWADASESATTPLKTTLSTDADVVYYYQGLAYPLYLQEGSTTDLVQDATYTALQQATGQRVLVSFHYAEYPDHHVFLFDTDMEGYDYMEQHLHPQHGRQLKEAHHIDALREQLIATYGAPLDFDQPALRAAARLGIEAIRQALHIRSPFPRDLAAYIGVPQTSFSNGRHYEVLTVWEHSNTRGQSLNVENAPNTVIWDYGAFNCYTMAANPNLTLEFKPDGTNWNDCISSQCLSYVDGADAMIVAYYKDIDYGIYACGRQYFTYRPNSISYPRCLNMRDWVWKMGFPQTCGHMNDQISSIRIKAIWQGCQVDYSDL